MSYKQSEQFDMFIIAVKDKAILACMLDDKKRLERLEYWLPLSQILINGEAAEADELVESQEIEVDVPTWIATQKGMYS
jgi:hypothetical protein